MAVQESGEMYLETILMLSKKSSLVRSTDVAEYMEYSRASVCRGIGLLKKEGYVLMEKDGALTLTEAGRKLAEKVYEKHSTITGFLVKLGVPEETAVNDACRIEHVISDESFVALKKHAATFSEAT